MHVYRLAFFSVLATVLLLFPNGAKAQESLIGDGMHPQVRSSNANVWRNATRATATAPFPFFDDFSNDATAPDTTNWISDPENDEQLPTISNLRARNTPSKGVLTFDGATHKKRKHSKLAESGLQDVLESQSFDLSALNPSNDVYLSFFYQRGGWGDAPEGTDSLVVSFDTTGNGDYVTALTLLGNGAADATFDLVMLPLDEGFYFHPDFRFRFASYGSLNGELDQWHIDYVYFAANRGPDDTLFTDISPTKMLSGPLGEYTAMPRNFYENGGFNAAPVVEISNVSGPAQGAPVDLVLSDPTGNNSLTGTLSQTFSSTVLNPYENKAITAAAYSDQAASMNQYGTLRLTATSRLPGDTRPDNDTFETDYRIDTILAFDDGQPDAGYGLTTARSFCMEFRIPEPDTISAVWIAFPPSLHYNPVINQSTCMDGATFKLALWDTLVPDSFRTQQGTGMVIQYDSADNYFQRFTFINPQVVDTLFYLGISQNTDKPLGVGFDKQGPAGRLYFEGGNAEFTASSLSGSVMIRPEFADIKDPAMAQVNEQVRAGAQAKVYPNPWRAGELWLEFEEANLRSGTWQLLDLQGRTASQGSLTAGQRRSNLAVSEGLPGGIYLLVAEGKRLNGEHFAFRKRLLIQN